VGIWGLVGIIPTKTLIPNKPLLTCDPRSDSLSKSLVLVSRLFHACLHDRCCMCVPTHQVAGATPTRHKILWQFSFILQLTDDKCVHICNTISIPPACSFFCMPCVSIICTTYQQATLCKIMPDDCITCTRAGRFKYESQLQLTAVSQLSVQSSARPTEASLWRKLKELKNYCAYHNQESNKIRPLILNKY
jgi:hypothetical protein